MSTSNPSSPNEKFIFKCDQHAASISGKLQKFYEEKDFFDTVLIAGNNCIKIPAHKIVLSALSDYFCELFRGSPTTSKTNEVKLENIDASSLKLIIDYMYSGTIELSLEKIVKILRSAVFLKMENLVNECSDFVERNINKSNCLFWLHLAKELKLTSLQEKSSNLIQYTNLEEITKQPEFLLLNKIELEDLLFNDNHRGDFEEQVFLGLVTWIEYEKPNRQHLLFELLSMVRYQYLTPKFIVENSFSVSKTVENCELILRWLKYHLSPESRTSEQQNFTLSSEPKREVDLPEEISKIALVHINNKKEAEIQCYNETLKNWSIEKRSRLLSINKSMNNNSWIVIDKKLFIVGGYSDDGKVTTLNNVQCVDLESFKLTDLPPMRVARYRSQLANLNGHLCVFGGYGDYNNKKFIDSVEIFNFSTGKWSDLEPLIKPDEQSKIFGHNGILYIFNFRYGSLQCYDVASNQWTSKKQPIDDSVKDFQIAAVGNFVYVFCYEDVFTSSDRYDIKLVVKRFDLSNYTWCEVVKVPEFKGSIKKVTELGNKILISNYYYNEIVEYNPETNEFTTLTNLNLNNYSFFPFKL